MDQRDRELLGREAVRFSSGVAIIVTIVAAAVGLLTVFAAYRSDPRMTMTWKEAAPLASAIAGVLFLLSIPIAILTRKESRADVANEFLNQGMRASPNDHPVLQFIVALALFGLLQGEFMAIDAMKAWWVRLKLRGVDRDRAAVILAVLVSRPEGVMPGELLRHGESPRRLRKTLAYLIASEWADVSRDWQHITLLSPAKRAIRS